MDLDGLGQLLERQFTGVNQRLDQLTEQVKLTNGTVRKHETDIALLQAAPVTPAPIGDNRTITKWDVFGWVGVAMGTFAVLKMLGVLR